MKFKFKMFIVIFGFAIFLADISKISGGEFYNYENRNYFVSFPEKRNWYQALRYCSYNGMYLIDVHSAAENDRILAIINKTEVAHRLSRQDYWTCGTDLGSEGNFYWASSGHQFIFMNFHSKTPNGNGGVKENCVHFWQGNTHKWNAWNCDESMYFICRDTFDVPIYKAHSCPINTCLG